MYCPFTPPSNPPGSKDCSEWETYNQENLPIRNNDTFRYDATHIEETADKIAADLTGIAGQAILSRLPSIDFPRSFPPDSMHLFYENVIPAMIRHYRGIFFKKHYVVDTSAGGAVGRGHGPRGGPGSSGGRRQSTVNLQSRVIEGMAEKADGGVGRGGIGSSRQRLQVPIVKFRKTPDPWNVDPKVWERIGKDQKVCKSVTTRILAARAGMYYQYCLDQS